MPSTPRWASILLAVAAVVWVARLLATWVVTPPGDGGVGRPAYETAPRGDGPGWAVPVLIAPAVVQVLLCVLVRTGRRVVRVALTLSATPLGLLAWALVLVSVVDRVEASGRAAGLGLELPTSPVVDVLFLAEVLVAVSSAVGLVLLHRPATGAWFRQVRPRDGMRTGG